MADRESPVHIGIVSYLRVNLPYGWMVSHAANGGIRSPRDQAKFIAMGLRPGFPDIQILGQMAGKPWVGFLEVKAPAVRVQGKTIKQAGRLSPEQRDVIDTLLDMGFPVAVVSSIDEARDACRQWKLPIREVLPLFDGAAA